MAMSKECTMCGEAEATIPEPAVICGVNNVQLWCGECFKDLCDGVARGQMLELRKYLREREDHTPVSKSEVGAVLDALDVAEAEVTRLRSALADIRDRSHTAEEHREMAAEALHPGVPTPSF